MQRKRQYILTLAVVCLLIAGSGGVTATKYDQPSRSQPTITTHQTVRVEFANDSTVVIHGSAERVGIGTTWNAPDGAATSYFESGPVNGTTRLDVPKEGKQTAITYVTVYSGGNMTPILTVENPTRASANLANSSSCRLGATGDDTASSV